MFGWAYGSVVKVLDSQPRSFKFNPRKRLPVRDYLQYLRNRLYSVFLAMTYHHHNRWPVSKLDRWLHSRIIYMHCRKWSGDRWVTDETDACWHAIGWGIIKWLAFHQNIYISSQNWPYSWGFLFIRTYRNVFSTQCVASSRLCTVPITISLSKCSPMTGNRLHASRTVSLARKWLTVAGLSDSNVQSE